MSQGRGEPVGGLGYQTKKPTKAVRHRVGLGLNLESETEQQGEGEPADEG